MVNTNEIKNISDAKNAKYNGKLLKEEEKSVFDHPKLKECDLIYLRKTATLLDNVKEAEVIDSKESKRILELWRNLRSAQTDKKNKWRAYHAINSYNQQIDKAMNKLQEKISSFELNIQGVKGGEVFAEEEFKLANVDITSEGSKDRVENVQGISGSGNVRLSKAFEIRGSSITVGKQKVKTEEDIKDEITTKSKQLERKEKILKIYEEKSDVEKIEKTEDEISNLENVINKLNSELRQLEIQPK